MGGALGVWRDMRTWGGTGTGGVSMEDMGTLGGTQRTLGDMTWGCGEMQIQGTGGDVGGGTTPRDRGDRGG